MTLLKSIRLFCLDCMMGDKKEVSLCPSTECRLYNYRKGKKVVGKNKNMSLLIKKFCNECTEDNNCYDTECQFYKYREDI